jgi:maltose phosphorylase
MKNYIKVDEWNIIEEGFDPSLNKISESIFSIGNGRFGQRANFEEYYSGDTLQGNYVAGIYYPDKTRVGWWKNGYPEYFAKVLNAANWLGILVKLDDEILDLNTCIVSDFKRTLHMREGYLERSFTAEFKNGKRLKVNTKRFCSIADDEIGAIRYSMTPLNFSDKLTITSFIDGDVKNQDSNYDEKFWDEVSQEISNESAYLTLRTQKTNFDVSTGMKNSISKNNEPFQVNWEAISKEKFVGIKTELEVEENIEYTVYKYSAIVSSENYSKPQVLMACKEALTRSSAKGFEKLFAEQAAAWAKKWEESDIIIEGDVAAQQGIRFNIFQLHQTYTGEDARLNIGPKGFTGEKYGGSTYWDTEAYCIPFYLSTAESEVSRNLLIYRYRHLQKAIENAAKLGFENGAALYPMVTMNGEECHNEWEITFEEIHRNGAIAYAIFNYIRYTGDQGYLIDYGLEVLIAIARFWSQRVNWSDVKKQFVILGVTGPNEYENNVNNNWYTNLIASWCLNYTMEALAYVEQNSPDTLKSLITKTTFNKSEETARWKEIISNMYYPEDRDLGIFLQQDGYLDKEQILVRDLDKKHYPIHQNWSWDRILRSCFIKQADVLQGMYFFEDDYDEETLRRNFDFYEARTIHESSLSPCVHSILAAKLGDERRAYEFYLRTARLDLDDYNNDTQDGLHITSMAGTWMSVVEGFAGMRVRDGSLHFKPMLPEKWESYSFTILFRGFKLNLKVKKDSIEIINHSIERISVFIQEKEYSIEGNSRLEI